MDKLEMLPITECDCEVCSKMCHAPCTGTPDDMQKIIDAGYGDRLCLDDWPGQVADLHPALKRYEGDEAPFDVRSEEGCTFWKDGKCELHEKGLKPLGGKIAHHAMDPDVWKEFARLGENSWDNKEAKNLIESWRSKYFYIEE